MSITRAVSAIGGNIMDNGNGYRFPNVVIEVAYKKEPLLDSCNERSRVIEKEKNKQLTEANEHLARQGKR
jgi:hypothetical protein